MPKTYASNIAALPAARIISALGDAAARWTDADFPPRVRATESISERTGYAVPVVEYALDQLFGSITEPALRATIVGELGTLRALDDFVQRMDGAFVHAAPIGNVCVISSRTTIGVGIIPAIFALCAKCQVTVKDREDALVAAFFETLSQDDAFAQAATAQTWEGAAADLSVYEAVVAFGKTATLCEIRSALSTGARFIGYGSRASAGYITREALRNTQTMKAAARGAARDLVLYDTEGCLSLHMLFIEDNDNADHFFAEFARAIERATIEFPIGRREQSALARLSHLRNAAAFRAATGKGAVYSDDACSFVVMRNAPAEEPPPFAPRALATYTVGKPSEAVEYLAKHRIELEAFALCDDRPDVVEAAKNCGAVRLTRFGELQHPPVSGNHGGRPRIAEFIRWIDKEV